MTRISDEMLMAYADGELEPGASADVRRAVEADPELGRKVAMFARTRADSVAAFGPVIDEPVPEALVAAIRRSAPAKLKPQRRQWFGFLIPAAALAAAAVVGYLGGAVLSPSAGGLPTAEIASAVNGLPTGASATVAGSAVTIAGSYATPEGYCRVLGIASAEGGWRAVACGSGGRWAIEMVVADATAHGGYTPASGGVAEAIDAFLDGEGAGGTLDAAAEEAAIGGNWRPAAGAVE